MSDKIITFVSTVDGLENIEECRPKPTKYYIPDWFKNIPGELNNTVRKCPSFPDFFSLGYVLPMWMDSKIVYDEKNDTWSYKQPSNLFPNWETHSNDQMLNYVDASFHGINGNFIFKSNSPWKLITPPGWSVLQMPMFYHFNKEWSVMPGVLDTDIHHELNQQVLYHGDGKEIFIERGEPLVMYIPFKRDSRLDLEIRYMTDEDVKLFNNETIDMKSKFSFSGNYRKKQRDRDSRG